MSKILFLVLVMAVALCPSGYAQDQRPAEVVARTVGIEPDCVLLVESEKVRLLVFAQRLPVQNVQAIDFANEVVVESELVGAEKIAPELADRYRDGKDKLLLAYFGGKDVTKDRLSQVQIELLSAVNQLVEKRTVGLALIKRETPPSVNAGPK